MVNKHLLLLIFLLVSSCLFFRTTKAALRDSLEPGEVLDNISHLQSPNGRWSLGYFISDNKNYLGIWSYKSSSERPFYVWIANRNKPVDSSAVLALDHSGVLKIIHNDSRVVVNLHSPIQATNRTVATLADSGNLILKEVYTNGSTKRILWQSFDHPTDTLLPGMKLGFNYKTGQSWSLVSWSTDIVPNDGPFTLTWEPKRGELVIRRRGDVYWTSGVLRQKKFLSISDQVQGIYEYSIVSNRVVEYFTYKCELKYSGWMIFPKGQLYDISGREIANAEACYGYNTIGGCQRWEVPFCRHQGDTFEVRTGYIDPLVSSFGDKNLSLTISDCKATCWSNCNCTGFATMFENGTGCVYYEGKWGANSLASGSYSFHMLVPKPSYYKGKMTKMWVVAIIATSVLIIGFCILCLLLINRKAPLEVGENRERMGNAMPDLVNYNRGSNLSELQDRVKKGQDFIVYSYACLLEATNGFSSDNKLGEGGFGPVYKGKLPVGEVAIKRLSRHSGQGVIEFKNELTLISELQHMNLVQLLGCCIHEEERMLIYEYLPNRSLDFFIFDSTRSKLLDWKKRFDIMEGIAQGLLYLHKYSRLRVVHRDLKASNILLDENMNPKISDFGMARIFTQESESSTNRIVGTYGYMSPEYAMEGVFSIKSDVYSFGVLMLEIVSGRRNNKFHNADRPLNLVGYAWELWREGLGVDLMDPTLGDSCIQDQMLRCIHIGLLSVEECSCDRPTMADIVLMLTNESVSLPLPKRPAFYCGRRRAGNAQACLQDSTEHSVNGMSTTNIDPR